MSIEYAVQMQTEYGWSFCALNNRTTKRFTPNIDEAKDSLFGFRHKRTGYKFHLVCRYVGDWCECKEGKL